MRDELGGISLMSPFKVGSSSACSASPALRSSPPRHDVLMLVGCCRTSTSPRRNQLTSHSVAPESSGVRHAVHSSSTGGRRSLRLLRLLSVSRFMSLCAEAARMRKHGGEFGEHAADDGLVPLILSIHYLHTARVSSINSVYVTSTTI